MIEKDFATLIPDEVIEWSIPDVKTVNLNVNVRGYKEYRTFTMPLRATIIEKKGDYFITSITDTTDTKCQYIIPCNVMECRKWKLVDGTPRR